MAALRINDIRKAPTLPLKSPLGGLKRDLTFLPLCMECRRGLAMRIMSVRPSVCLSVRLQNAWIVTKRKNNQSLFYTIRKIYSLVFWEKVWLVEVTPSTWNFGSTAPPRWSEIAEVEPIFFRSASAVKPGEKVQLTLTGSPLRAFHRA